MNATAAAAPEKVPASKEPAMMAIQIAHPAEESITVQRRPILSMYKYGGQEKMAYCVKAADARISDML